MIGNAGYQAGALATPANDAGLIAQTLQATGFDVVGARDLDQNSLRRAFSRFSRASHGRRNSGPGPMSGSKKAKRPLGSLAEWPLRRTAGVLRFRSPCARLGRPLGLRCDDHHKKAFSPPETAIASSNSDWPVKWCIQRGRIRVAIPKAAAPLKTRHSSAKRNNTLGASEELGRMASVKAAICAVCMHNLVCKSDGALHAANCKASLSAQIRKGATRK